MVIDLYRMYQATVARGGITLDAADHEWCALAAGCSLTGAPAAVTGTAIAIRSMYNARMRGFVDFMADLVRQYEIAKREAMPPGMRPKPEPRGWAGAAPHPPRPKPPPQRPTHVHVGPRYRPPHQGGPARTPPPEVPDLVPGKPLVSMVRWLQHASLGIELGSSAAAAKQPDPVAGAKAGSKAAAGTAPADGKAAAAAGPGQAAPEAADSGSAAALPASVAAPAAAAALPAPGRGEQRLTVDEAEAAAKLRGVLLLKRYRACFQRAALALRAPLPPELHALFGAHAMPRRSGRTRVGAAKAARGWSE